MSRLVFLELVTYGQFLRQNMMKSGDFRLHQSLKKNLRSSLKVLMMIMMKLTKMKAVFQLLEN